MKNVNNITLAGTLTDIYDGNNFVSARVCVDTGRKARGNGEPIIYRINVVAYGYQADSLRKLKEGDHVIAEGRFSVYSQKGKDTLYSVNITSISAVDGGNQNHVIMQGRLTKDPETRQTKNGSLVSAATLAVDYSYKPKGSDEWKTQTSFVPITHWGELDANLVKGAMVWVTGSLSPRSYEGKDSKRHYITEVLAESIRVAGSGRANTSAKNDAPAPVEDDDDEELPF